LGLLVAHGHQPVGDRLLAVGSLVSKDLDHAINVAYKLHDCKHFG
jgi:hypothetical protein